MKKTFTLHKSKLQNDGYDFNFDTTNGYCEGFCGRIFTRVFPEIDDTVSKFEMTVSDERPHTKNVRKFDLNTRSARHVFYQNESIQIISSTYRYVVENFPESSKTLYVTVKIIS